MYWYTDIYVGMYIYMCGMVFVVYILAYRCPVPYYIYITIYMYYYYNLNV